MDHNALNRRIKEHEKLFYSPNTYLFFEVKCIMAQKIMKLGIKREPGYLYFLDKHGDPTRVPMARAGKRPRGGREKIASASVKKEPGYLYFIDKQGDIARARMARGGKKKKAAKAKAKAKAKVKRAAGKTSTRRR